MRWLDYAPQMALKQVHKRRMTLHKCKVIMWHWWRYYSDMNIQALAAKLGALPNKRGFAIRHGLPTRTMWRIIGGAANPTASTIEAFEAALRSESRRKSPK